MTWRQTSLSTVLLAFALGVVAPVGADAQVRERKQRTRITAAERKASAEARKAKMAEAQRQNPGVKYAHAPKAEKKSEGGGR